MYEPPREEEPAGCRETMVITRAAFAVLLPPLLVMVFVLGAIGAAAILFAIHPALALVPVAVVAVGVYLFARWERGRFRTPGP